MPDYQTTDDHFTNYSPSLKLLDHRHLISKYLTMSPLGLQIPINQPFSLESSGIGKSKSRLGD